MEGLKTEGILNEDSPSLCREFIMKYYLCDEDSPNPENWNRNCALEKCTKCPSIEHLDSDLIDWSKKVSIKQWKTLETEKDGKTSVINSLNSVEDSLERFLKVLNLQGVEIKAHF